MIRPGGGLCKIDGRHLPSFDGCWSTTKGDMVIFTEGDTVHGWYPVDRYVTEVMKVIQDWPGTPELHSQPSPESAAP